MANKEILLASKNFGLEARFLSFLCFLWLDLKSLFVLTTSRLHGSEEEVTNFSTTQPSVF